jgi:aminoglycoside phosphotransferase (APT) family kinase protein
VVGMPFCLIERLQGRIFAECVLFGMQSSERHTTYPAMAGTMGGMHKLDWAEIVLFDYGRHGSYFTRQIACWTQQWEMSKTQDNPDIELLIVWLRGIFRTTVRRR